MDEEFRKLQLQASKATGMDVVSMHIDDDGLVEIDFPDGQRKYQLKPLGELYGHGFPGVANDPQNETFEPLYQTIELAIAAHDRHSPVTDADAAAALHRMSLNPEEQVELNSDEEA